MVNARKNLKQTSIVVLIFAALSLIKIALDAILGGLIVKIPEDQIPAEILQILPVGTIQMIVTVAGIVTFVFAILLLLPDIFLGLRGMKMADAPEKTKGHITWAKVLFVFAIITLISSFSSLSGNANIITKILAVLDPALSVGVYFMYIKAATAVYNEAAE